MCVWFPYCRERQEARERYQAQKWEESLEQVGVVSSSPTQPFNLNKPPHKTHLEWNRSNPDTNGAEESVIVSEVSSFQRLKCMQEWYILGVGKGVLFREVSLVQECPHRERERGSTVTYIL